MTAPGGPARSTARAVLVIDDSRVARQQLRQPLEEAGYRVVEAGNGDEGLTELALHSDVALVLCDVNMPVRDGIGFLQALAADPRAPRPPVVMITTEQQVELVQQAKRAGARGWIVKPFQPSLVVATARRLVGPP